MAVKQVGMQKVDISRHILLELKLVRKEFNETKYLFRVTAVKGKDKRESGSLADISLAEA